MKKSRIWQIICGVLLIIGFTSTSAGGQAPIGGEGIIPNGADPDATRPLPITPGEPTAFIYTKTPKFYFTRHMTALEYQIKVINGYSDEMVYEFNGKGTCTVDYCWLQPDFKLMNYSLTPYAGGAYYWYVQARDDSGWLGYTTRSGYFSVMSKGFNATFDVNAKKWQPINSTWTLTANGRYKTYGTTGLYSSAAHTERFLDNYVYEVRIKRKANGMDHSYVIVHGIPSSLGGDNTWFKGIAFGYTNFEMFRVWSMKGSGGNEILIDNTYFPYINEYGWNTLTVWTDYPYVYFWINGIFAGRVVNDTSADGWVGFGMYQSYPESAPLVVDNARLYYAGLAPYAISDTALGEPLNLQMEGEGE